jgi:hypothetical protein
MGDRWVTVTMVSDDGRRYSVDVRASSTFDGAHLFITHAKANPRSGIPRPTIDSNFEVVVDGTVRHITGKNATRAQLEKLPDELEQRETIESNGERGRNRTFNLLIKSQLLCQLSYAPTA